MVGGTCIPFGLDGYLHAKAFRRGRDEHNPRNVAIIAITADTHYHDSSAGSKHGMDGYIAKPITAVELNGLIDQYCRVP